MLTSWDKYPWILQEHFYTGVDHSGPFITKTGPPHSKTISKCSTATFISPSTRAMHLETVNELTPRTFTEAFQHFIARSKHLHIHNDKETIFAGAKSKLLSYNSNSCPHFSQAV
jgi:hypothetical protein